MIAIANIAGAILVNAALHYIAATDPAALLGQRVAVNGEPATIAAVSSAGRIAVVTDNCRYIVTGAPVPGEQWTGDLEDETPLLDDCRPAAGRE